MQWDLLHMLAMNIELIEMHNIHQFAFLPLHGHSEISENTWQRRPHYAFKWRSKVNEEDILVDQTRKRTLLYMLGYYAQNVFFRFVLNKSKKQKKYCQWK